MTFYGKYYNGKSSTGHAAEITLDTYHIRISYSDSLGNHHITHWDTDKVHQTDFTEHDHVLLKYGSFPFAYIEVYDKNMEHELKRCYPNAKFHQSVYNRLFSTGVLGLAALVLITIGFMALSYFVLIPAAAEKVAEKLPLSYEQQLGDAVYANMTRFSETNEESTALINHFFKQLNFKSDYPIQITVVKDDMVNAFALPGGKIVVYEGIINRMHSYEELAALLSHEFSHVQYRHTTKNICRSLSSYLLISLLIGDAGGITAVVVENANQLKQLGYSRQLEEEADREGLKLMRKSRIDITGMKHLFERLKEATGGDEGVPQFLSTHPLTDSRIQFVEKEIKKGKNDYEQQPVLDSLFELLQGDKTARND